MSNSNSSSRSSAIQVGPVVHDAKHQRFTCELSRRDDNNNRDVKGQGLLSYQILAKQSSSPQQQQQFFVEYDHVEVPVEFKGHDLGKVLADAAFEHARQHGWKIKVTCPYLVRKYVSLDAVKEKYGENFVL